MQHETKFKNKVVAKLDEWFLPQQVWYTKIQQMAKKGDPDFILCVMGTFEAWELKTEDGKVSALQQHTLNKIMDAGGTAIIVTPSNLNQHLKRLLDKVELLDRPTVS